MTALGHRNGEEQARGARPISELVVQAHRVHVGVRLRAQRVEAVALPLAADAELRVEVVLHAGADLVARAAVVAAGAAVELAAEQADAAEGAWWGSIYEEGGKRGVLANGWTGKGEKVVRAGDWNDYEIFAKGDMIQLTLNGLVTATIWDKASASGIIALQLHAGPPMQASFRNIRIKTLD